MNHSVFVSHYARALFKVALSDEQLEKQLADFNNVLHLVETTPPLKDALLDPSIAKEKKTNILQTLLSNKIDSAVLHFLCILIHKRRFHYLVDIHAEYQQLVKKKLGIVTAHVKTAVLMNATVKKKLQNHLAHIYQKRVEMTESVDAQLIGGMVLTIGNQMMDDSVKTRLNKLKESLLEVHI